MGFFTKDDDDFGSQKNKGVLYGTVMTYECDPEEDCKKCEGSGRCPKCEGEGSTVCGECGGDGACHHCGGQGSTVCEECHGDGVCHDCHGSGGSPCEGNFLFEATRKRSAGSAAESSSSATHCGGSGVCQLCHGSGISMGRECVACHGSGNCRYCGGTGTIACGSCKGSAHCHKCGGDGQVRCDSCRGSGQCRKCEGSGRITCDDCGGDGECTKCNGHGRLQCPRCKGMGAYQQFTTYTIKGIRKDACFTGSLECAKCIREAEGEVVFDGMQKKWASVDVVETDCTDEVDELGQNCDADLYSEFQAQYREFLDAKAPKSDAVSPYRKMIKIEDVRLAKIEYVVDDKPYVMYIMGNNDIVACEEVPKNIEALKLSIFEKAKLLAMTLFRKKEYAQLAHYIFKIDGVADAETRMLNVAIKKCCDSPEKEEAFKEELKKFDPASMPFEELRKQTKALFASRKLIAFVWQCIAVDKQVTPKEEEFFNKVVAEFKKVTPEQVAKIKALASRIAKLSDEEILDEYLTIRN